MVRFLERQGFTLLRARGGHHYFDCDGVHTTVPVHGNKPLKVDTLRRILRDINMSPVEFEELLEA